VHEVSRRVWGLRLRRTEQKLALSLLHMLPSAHINRVGVRVVSFRSSIAPPRLLCDLCLVSRGYGSQLVSEFFGCGCQTSDAVLAITGFECGGTFVHVRLAPSQEPVNKSS